MPGPSLAPFLLKITYCNACIGELQTFDVRTGSCVLTKDEDKTSGDYQSGGSEMGCPDPHGVASLGYSTCMVSGNCLGKSEVCCLDATGHHRQCINVNATAEVKYLNLFSLLQIKFYSLRTGLSY